MELPPGFRFHPTDEEIITHYLTRKVLDNSFTAKAVGQVDFNKCEPWDLPEMAKMGEDEWYFFCQKDRKYPTGTRTNRATGSGYWKATGKDKEVYKGNRHRGCVVGMKKTLVFYTGRAPKGHKSNWVMHEYRLHGDFPSNFPSTDEWAVCRVFHKNKTMISTTKTIPSLARIDSFGVDDLLFYPELTLSTQHENNNGNSDDTFDNQSESLHYSHFVAPKPIPYYPSGYYYPIREHKKIEQISSNQSIATVSHETGLSYGDVNAEISSAVQSIDNLECLWEY